MRYDRQWLTRVLSAINVVRGVGLVLGSVLAIAAALTVANVVRLALYARREELEIMDLVGAPQAYVRGPFVMEGVLQGGIGAAAALVGPRGGVLCYARRLPRAALASAVNLSRSRSPIQLCAGLLLVGGMVVGCIGGLVAAWKPLKKVVTLENLDTGFANALHWELLRSIIQPRGSACHAS